MGRLIGCAGLLAVMGFLAVEVWFFILVSGWMCAGLYQEAGHEWIGAIVLMIVIMVIGWRSARWHLRQIPTTMLAGKAGRHFIGAVGGALLVVPGFLTDVVGLILLLPPVQIALSAIGNKLVSVVAAQAMRRMMGGGGGAFPGMFAGGFPGGAAGGLKPDDALRFPGMSTGGKRPPKTYDTTVEK